MLVPLRLHVCSQFSNLVVSIIMLVSGYNNIILLPNCTLLYYVFSGPLSLCAYVPEIKFNNKCVTLHLPSLFGSQMPVFPS